MRISDWSSDVCSSDLALPLKPWLRRSRHEFDRPAPRLVFVYALPEKACNWRPNYEFSRARGNREGSGRRRQGDPGRGRKIPHHQEALRQHQARKRVAQGKSVHVRVDSGGRRLIKTKHIIELNTLLFII